MVWVLVLPKLNPIRPMYIPNLNDSSLITNKALSPIRFDMSYLNNCFEHVKHRPGDVVWWVEMKLVVLRKQMVVRMIDMLLQSINIWGLQYHNNVL
jgi:hypothetical protein